MATLSPSLLCTRVRGFASKPPPRPIGSGKACLLTPPRPSSSRPVVLPLTPPRSSSPPRPVVSPPPSSPRYASAAAVIAAHASPPSSPRYASAAEVLAARAPAERAALEREAAWAAVIVSILVAHGEGATRRLDLHALRGHLRDAAVARGWPPPPHEIEWFAFSPLPEFARVRPVWMEQVVQRDVKRRKRGGTAPSVVVAVELVGLPSGGDGNCEATSCGSGGGDSDGSGRSDRGCSVALPPTGCAAPQTALELDIQQLAAMAAALRLEAPEDGHGGDHRGGRRNAADG